MVTTTRERRRVAMASESTPAGGPNVSARRARRTMASVRPSAANSSSAWSMAMTTVGGRSSVGACGRASSCSSHSRRSRPAACCKVPRMSARVRGFVLGFRYFRKAASRTAARPVVPLMAARSGRITGSGRNWRSSRSRRGQRPARRKEDFPAPDAPRMTSIRWKPRSRRPRRVFRPSMILASRPKKTAASSTSSGRKPGYGASPRLVGRGPREGGRVQAGLLEALLQSLESRPGECHLCGRDVRMGDLEDHPIIAGHQVADLEFGNHLGA